VTFGDLDVAIKLGPTERWSEASEALMKKNGKQFSTFRAMMSYPERLVWQRIRDRLPRISLHGTEELEKNPQMGGIISRLSPYD
jgi:hypothetical protein